MITGFARHALVVFPDEEILDGRSHNYVNKLSKAARNVHKYLTECGVTFDCFITDSVAVDTGITVDRWIATLNQGDRFFVANNCEGVYTGTNNVIIDEEINLECAKKFPIERGWSFDRRFESVLKRDAKAKRDIASKYKLVILFTASNKMPVKYKNKPGTMCISIDAYNFIAKVMMASSVIDPIEILGIPNGNAPAYEWEV